MPTENSTPGDVTQLLAAWRNGDRSALDRMIPLVYDELRAVAGRMLRRDSLSPTLQPTALVHEAYLRLVNRPAPDWQNRAHFYGIAANLIRNILVDRARAQRADKRGGEAQRLSLDENLAVAQRKEMDLVALDDALQGLARLDPQQCRIVELRFFTGLSIEETAEVLGVSPSTVKRDWVLAKTWLLREMS